MLKLCPDCNIEKEEAEFNQGKRKIPRCLSCQNLMRKRTREKKKEEAPNLIKNVVYVMQRRMVLNLKLELFNARHVYMKK